MAKGKPLLEPEFLHREGGSLTPCPVRVLCTSRWLPVPPHSDPPSDPSPERTKGRVGRPASPGAVGGDWGACHPSPFQTQSSNPPASVFPRAPPPHRCSCAHSLHTSQMLWFSVGCSVSLRDWKLWRSASPRQPKLGQCDAQPEASFLPLTRATFSNLQLPFCSLPLGVAFTGGVFWLPPGGPGQDSEVSPVCRQRQTTFPEPCWMAVGLSDFQVCVCHT